MHVTYGFVYYIILIFMFATALLLLFVVRSIRKAFFDFAREKKIAQSIILQAVLALTFIVIFIILADSVMTYYSLSRNLQKSNYFYILDTNDLEDFALDNFELVQVDKKEDYLSLYRNYREFYLAERNFMLTSSALFAYFALQSLLKAISKLNDIENEREVKDLPEGKSTKIKGE